jgi:hypothetical protein
MPLREILERRKEARAGKVITIVSGLPRSGTSLMMQMLAAGGMPILGDTTRADESNPHGYYEWPEITEFPRTPGIIHLAEGKAVKLTSNFLCMLPPAREYKIILMERPLDEVLPSMEKMHRRLHPGDEAGAQAITAPEFRTALEALMLEVKHWLEEQPNLRMRILGYHDLLAHPIHAAMIVANFMGFAPVNSAVMAACVDPTLYRSRKMPTIHATMSR